MWMASATPGGAPGYDDDKQFGNFITHSTVQTSQRLRGTYLPDPKSQGKAGNYPVPASVAGFLAPGEAKMLLAAMREYSSLVMPGLVPGIHALLSRRSGAVMVGTSPAMTAP
jgi:hypothetical protein